MNSRFFTSFPFAIPVDYGLENLSSIVATKKQVLWFPGDSHEEAFTTKGLEASISYFPPDWGGYGLFLIN